MRIRSVLVVEDEDAQRNALVELLRDANYHVRGAASAHEAESLHRSHPADVVLVDLQLGDCSGVDVIARLRSIDIEARLIITTGLDVSSPDFLDEIACAGADGLILKPIDFADLVRAIEAPGDEPRMRPKALRKRLSTGEFLIRAHGQTPSQSHASSDRLVAQSKSKPPSSR